MPYKLEETREARIESENRMFANSLGRREMVVGASPVQLICHLGSRCLYDTGHHAPGVTQWSGPRTPLVITRD
jgi:hypothetical protein